MSLLTDQDIKKLLGKDIVIEPFYEDGLTPVGYDFHIGDFIYSLEKGLLEPNDGVYELPAKSTIQILTKESLWVSSRIGGVFHSKVSLVSKGLSHIATTLDPLWYGPLLITLRNNTDEPFIVDDGAAFVTLLMFKVNTPTKTPHNKPAFRQDILLQFNSQTENYIKKVGSLIGKPQVLQKFEQAVKNANKPMLSKISTSMNTRFWHNTIVSLLTVILYLIIIILSGLQFYWNKINWFFNGIPYDSNIFLAQVTAILASVTALTIIIKKKD